MALSRGELGRSGRAWIHATTRAPLPRAEENRTWTAPVYALDVNAGFSAGGALVGLSHTAPQEAEPQQQHRHAGSRPELIGKAGGVSPLTIKDWLARYQLGGPEALQPPVPSLCWDPYADNKETGSFLFIDEATNATCAGMLQAGYVRGPRLQTGARKTILRAMKGLFRQTPGTIEDLLRRGEDERLELIRGTLVEKASPTAEHAHAQSGVDRHVGWRFARKPGGRWPGGWWILTELDIRFGAEVLRPDVCGFRRERISSPPTGRPVELRPDWVCEILSPTTQDRDRVEKLQTYFASGVQHYWLVDPVEGTLEVFRRTDLAYALVLSAHRGQRIRPEPFEAEEVSVDELLGGDPEDELE
jgi:Uma2 family endonuclease